MSKVIKNSEITIARKTAKADDLTHQIVSVRMPIEMVEKLDLLSAETNRSRNELVNMLLDQALDNVKVVE